MRSQLNIIIITQKMILKAFVRVIRLNFHALLLKTNILVIISE